jgi:hypothetical protein
VIAFSKHLLKAVTLLGSGQDASRRRLQHRDALCIEYPDFGFCMTTCNGLRLKNKAHLAQGDHPRICSISSTSAMMIIAAPEKRLTPSDRFWPFSTCREGMPRGAGRERATIDGAGAIGDVSPAEAEAACYR